MSTRATRGAAAAVAAVVVLQIVAFVITTAVWVASTIFAGNACDPDCDWAGAGAATAVYLSVAVVMFLCSAAAFVYAWRTGTALSWVPLVAAAGTVAGLWVALAMFRAAMS